MSDRLLEPDVVVVERVTAVAVVAEAPARGAAHGWVVVDRLAKAFEALEKGGNLQPEVDQHLVLLARPLVMADQDRGECPIGPAHQPMGEKAPLIVGPEQAIQVLGLSGPSDTGTDFAGQRVGTSPGACQDALLFELAGASGMRACRVSGSSGT